MNSLYNLALRQSSSIQSDLTLIESTPNGSASFASLSGQVSASLSAFGRTVDDYENMAKRELHIQKREKALQRVKKFREEEREMRAAFSNIKNRTTDSSTASSSANAFASQSRSTAAGSSESPFSLHSRGQAQQQQQQQHQQQQHQQYPPTNGIHAAAGGGGGGAHPPQDRPDPLSAYRMNASAAAMFGEGGGGSAREGYALREHSFIQQTENQLDSFIAQGREVWGNLTEQRDILKGTQRRLRDIGVTMGLSRDVIGYIERRSTQDNIIFGAGAIFTLVCFYYIYKWFG